MQSEFAIQSGAPFDFGLTASLFARFPSEVVDLYRDGVYGRVLDLGGRAVLAQVCGEGDIRNAPRLCVTATGEGLSSADDVLVENLLRKSFDLDFPLPDFYRRVAADPWIGPLTERYYGLRMLVRPYLFEALVMSITTQQINLTFAYNLKQRLVRAFGRAVDYWDTTYFAFPTPEALAGAAVADLRQMQYSERKAEYIIGLARLVASGEMDIEAISALPDEEFIAELTKVRGLGRWSAEWALTRGLGRPDVIAADDIGVQRAFSRYCFGGRPVKAPQVREMAERWRPYRSYAVQYLLMALFHKLEPWYEGG